MSASLHIGHLPGWKRPCLYYTDQNVLRPLAYFRDDLSAQIALAQIDRIARITPSNEWHGWRVGDID